MISDRNTLPSSLHNLVPGLPLSRIPAASHWLMMDRPEELWEILVDFLDAVTDRGAFDSRNPAARGKNATPA